LTVLCNFPLTIVKKGKHGCALIGFCWHEEAGSKLSRRRVSYMICLKLSQVGNLSCKAIKKWGS
jgi:hypothetical protein